jgi:recombination protein RecA
MAKKVKSQGTATAVPADVDELSQILSKALQTQFKDEQIVWNLNGSEESPTQVDHWISTGHVLLDLAISNRPHGGLPVGKIVEIYGAEASGKSLLAAHIIAETQKLGGRGIFIDTESAVSPEFFEAIGVDLSKLLYIQLETLEDIYSAMETLITTTRKNHPDELVTIVVDSIAGATTKVEQEADFDKDGYATTKSIINSKAMRKLTNLIGKQKILVVLTNQIRAKMNAMAFADPNTTSGGKAIGFHASVRIKMASKSRLRVENKLLKQKTTIGTSNIAEITKNRVGPPFRKAVFDIYFASGIDPYSGWPSLLKETNVIKSAAGYITFSNVNYREEGSSEPLKIKSSDFNTELNNRPELKEELYMKICEILIMNYKDTDSAILGDEGVSNDLSDDDGDISDD